MENFKVVRPTHLNHYGYLFGGELLKWVDEISWLAASRDYPGCKFVTVSMDQVVFQRSVRQGSMLRFDVQPYKVGKTSIQYTVTVYRDDLDTGLEEVIFTTHVTFVRLNEDGEPARIPQDRYM